MNLKQLQKKYPELTFELNELGGFQPDGWSLDAEAKDGTILLDGAEHFFNWTAPTKANVVADAAADLADANWGIF